jgi:hypothetical protein
MKELLIVAPVVALYSPIVLVFAFVTKIWPRLVTGTTHSAAATAPMRTAAKAARNWILVSVFIGLCGYSRKRRVTLIGFHHLVFSPNDTVGRCLILLRGYTEHD